MKRLVCVLVCLLVLATGAMAQDDVPSLRQSTTYFSNFTKESSVLLAQVRESLDQARQAEGAPRTDACLFYAELAERMERLMLLTANVNDFFVLYDKTTYCYGKQEKDYLYGRIASLQSELQRLIDAPYAVDAGSLEGDKARMHDRQFLFAERVARLRAFIAASLAVFRR